MKRAFSAGAPTVTRRQSARRGWARDTFFTSTRRATRASNTAAARGRIVDADFAQETSNLSRAQILQQAGTAMVAQANALPQQVLQLLR